MTKKETTKFIVQIIVYHRIDCLSDSDCTGSHVLHGTLKRESSAKVEDSSYFQITSSRGRVITFRRSYQIRLEPWICFWV